MSSAKLNKKKTGKVFQNALKNDKMCQEFYDDLESKMLKCENSVRDIIKNYEKENKIKHFDSNMLDISPDQKRNILNEILLRFFDGNSFAMGCNKLWRIHNFTDDELCAMDSARFAEYDSFIVIGCKESTDIDVVCFVRECDIYNGNTKELSEKSIKLLKEELKTCGYDMRRKLDINTAFVDSKSQMITASSKAGLETQNIIIATWSNHKQIMDLPTKEVMEILPLALVRHPMINIKFTKKYMYEKIRSFAKYVLDHCEHICYDYKKFRPIKIDLYTIDGYRMMRFMKDISKYIIYDPAVAIENKIDMIEWHNRFKAIIMKLLQIIWLHKCDKTAYNKMEIADSVRYIFKDDESVLVEKYISIAQWYLFRGRIGKFDPVLGPKFFELLIRLYCEVVDEFLES